MQLDGCRRFGGAYCLHLEHIYVQNCTASHLRRPVNMSVLLCTRGDGTKTYEMGRTCNTRAVNVNVYSFCREACTEEKTTVRVIVKGYLVG
jgi:hypothetical protein